LRDAAIDLGMAVSDAGRPASDEDLKYVFDKYKVAPSARAALTKLWREVEGGA
jgi:predicted transcriptional regulator